MNISEVVVLLDPPYFVSWLGVCLKLPVTDVFTVGGGGGRQLESFLSQEGAKQFFSDPYKRVYATVFCLRFSYLTGFFARSLNIHGLKYIICGMATIL